MNPYPVAVFLSSLSLVFGILREFLLVYLLGFTAKNDLLQIYLSIFYTVGLAIDAVRLTCLNLFSSLPLRYLSIAVSILALPFSALVGVIIYCSTQGIQLPLLMLTIIGSYFNLIATLLITYKQRANRVLPAQFINVLPNFILIPGVLICYWTNPQQLVQALVVLTTIIPLIQCFFLLLLSSRQEETLTPSVSLSSAVFTCSRHFSTLLGDQLFQMLVRTTFFNFGAGYLSAYAFAIRIYSAFRFILVDSYIAAKLATWKKELRTSDFSYIYSQSFCLLLVILALLVSTYSTSVFHATLLQLGLILCFGFYLSTVVRIIYFKINHADNQAALVWRFTLSELFFAFLAFLLTLMLRHSILALVWLGYVAKPFSQLFILRKPFLDSDYGLYKETV